MRAVQAAKEVNGFAHDPPPLMDGKSSLTKQIDGCLSAAQALLSDADKGPSSGASSYIDFLMHQGLPLLRLLKNPNAFAALWLLESLSVPSAIISELRQWMDSADGGLDHDSTCLKDSPHSPVPPTGPRRTSALKGGRKASTKAEPALKPGSDSGENTTSTDVPEEEAPAPKKPPNARKSIAFWKDVEAETSPETSAIEDSTADDGEDDQDEKAMMRLRGGPTDEGEPNGRKSPKGKKKPSLSRDRRKRYTVIMDNLQLEPPPEEECIKSLRQIPTFARMSEEDLRKVAGITKRKMFGADEMIVNFGDSCDDIHIVYEGHSKVSVPHQISTIGQGSFFGDEALKNESATHQTQIMATGSPCTTLAVNLSEFRELGIRLAFERTNQHIARNLDIMGDSDVPGGDDVNSEYSRVVRCEEGPMTSSDRSLIIEAVKKNKVIGEVLSLTDEQHEAMVDQVYLVEIETGATLIQKGERGADLYIVQEGVLDVITCESMAAMHHFRTGDSFGEIGLLYDAPRTATIKAQRKCKLWVLCRSAFRLILRASHASVITEYAEILGRIPVITERISPEHLDMAAGALEEISFMEHDEVCEEGQDEGILFICYKGECNVLKDGEVARHMQKGDWIGERQLKAGVAAEETVKVRSENAIMLILDIASFNAVVNALTNLTTSNDASQTKGAVGARLSSLNLNPQYMDHIDKQKFADNCHRKRVSRKLTKGMSRGFGSVSGGTQDHDLRRCAPVALLGQGSFGTVAMFEDRETGAEYAIKRIYKEHVLKDGQVQLLCNERNTQILLESEFIVRLYRSYQDASSIFFMLEPVLGGELFEIYNDHNLFGDLKVAQFCIACVALGLHHMHLKRIIYRDLKLENCLLDKRGYLKLTDMGIAKVVIGKTYTVCGTVDYFAPETLKQVGHNRGVDWWACGVLLFIMLSGRSPFDAPEVAQIYKNIIKGFSKVKFPESIPFDCVDVIKSLCRKKPEERVTMQKGGIENLKEMPFFTSFSWENLSTRTLDPPFVPPPMDMEPAKRLLKDKGFEELKVKEWDGGVHEVDRPSTLTEERE